MLEQKPNFSNDVFSTISNTNRQLSIDLKFGGTTF